MANYTYSAWISQADDTARLTMLRLHIGEVVELIQPDGTAADESVNSAHMIQYLSLLLQRETYYSIRIGENTAYAGGLSYFNLRPAC